MDRKGANTFPFYNLPPEPRNISKKEFFCAFFLSLLDKIKVGGDSCLPRHFAKTNAKRKPAFQKNSQFFPPYHKDDSRRFKATNQLLDILWSNCKHHRASTSPETRCTVPSQFIATYLKGIPRSGLGSIELRYKPTKFIWNYTFVFRGSFRASRVNDK